MENKKTKLTISGSPKKSFKNFDLSKNQNKKTVVIDKQKNKPSSKGVHNKTTGFRSTPNNFKKNFHSKSNFVPKAPLGTSDFERRKLAEQRATKRLKSDNDKDKKTKLDFFRSD